MRKTSNERLLSIFLVLPLLILIGGVVFFPALYAFYMSLHELQLTRPQTAWTFIGFQNYINLFKDKIFLQALPQTLYYTALSIILSLCVSLGIALSLNLEFRGRALFRVFIVIPWAVPSTAVALTFKWIYNTDYGILNVILKKLGLISSNVAWLYNSSTALPMLIFTQSWRLLPIFTLFLLVTLQNIPKSLYEAAKMDGANVFKCFRYITLPFLRLTIAVVLVIQTMNVLKTFALIYIMTAGGPERSTEVINYYAYEVAFKFLNLGYGGSIAYVITVLILIFSLIYYGLLIRER